MNVIGGMSDRISSFILENYPLARKQGLTPKVALLESGILDSLGILDLVGFLEKEFGITFSDDDLSAEHFQSIEHLTAFLQKKGGEKL